MNWSFKLGRFLGIDVFVHFTFLLLLGFIGVAHWVAGQSVAAALSGVLFFGCLFACVLLHEYGHALMARRFGIGTHDITLLPAFPMDGGRVVRALLAMKLDYSRATQIAASLGKGMALMFAVAGLFGNPMLILIALFVWIGATQEAAATQFKSAVAGGLVREAALANFATVPPSATLRDLTKIMLSESQQDFPVVENGGVVGILVHAEILAAIKHRPLDTSVTAIMRTEFDIVEENSPLDELLTHLRHVGGHAIPVMGRGRLTGLLTAENLSEYSVIREASRSSSQPPPLPSGSHSLP